jgi:hypothetical protein
MNTLRATLVRYFHWEKASLLSSSHARKRRLTAAIKRIALGAALIGAVATAATTWTGCGGGGGSCGACRQDCINNGIPAGDCNCAGCTN